MWISPVVGTSRHPMRLRRVDFPEPEGPMMAMNSPGMNVHGEAVEGPDIPRRHRVDLGHLVQPDDGIRVGQYRSQPRRQK